MTIPTGDNADRDLERLADSAERVEATVTERFKVSKDAIARSVWLGGLGLLIGVIGIVLAVVSIRTVQAANRERDQRSVASCQQYNAQQRLQIAKDTALSHDLVTAIATGGGTRTLTPEAQSVVDRFNTKHDRLIVEKNALRDCSPAGIATYLEGIPKH